jgi:hypothetical protein
MMAAGSPLSRRDRQCLDTPMRSRRGSAMIRLGTTFSKTGFGDQRRWRLVGRDRRKA